MKPLTEVIEDAERCLLPFPGDCLNCPHFDSTDDDLGYDCMKKILRDAVGYLREYQAKRDEICEIAKAVSDSWELHKQTMAFEYRNDPLTWDELKGMRGKPVWIEKSYYEKAEWYLFRRFVDENTALFCDVNGCEGIGEKLYYGKSWNAYLKERIDEEH